MILLHLGINSLGFILNCIWGFVQSFKFLRIFASCFEEFEVIFENIINCFVLANNIAIIVELFIFMVFFLLKGNFAHIFIQVLGIDSTFTLSNNFIDFIIIR